MNRDNKMTVLEVADMLAAYSVEISNTEEIAEKGLVQLKHARLIKNAVVSISLPSDEEIREPIQNALYSTDRLTTDQCTELAYGILAYLNESDFKVVRQ